MMPRGTGVGYQWAGYDGNEVLADGFAVRILSWIDITSTTQAYIRKHASRVYVDDDTGVPRKKVEYLA